MPYFNSQCFRPFNSSCFWSPSTIFNPPNSYQNRNYVPSRQNNAVNNQTNPKYENSDFEFAKSLPKNPNATQTTIQVGRDGQKIKGYYATNPETGKTVYANEYGDLFTEQAFRNWEQFAKDGTFPK